MGTFHEPQFCRAGIPACRFWGLSSPQLGWRAGKAALRGRHSWAGPTARAPRIATMSQWSADILVGVIVPFTNHAGQNVGAPADGSGAGPAPG